MRTLRASLFLVALAITGITSVSNSSAADFSAVWNGSSGIWSDPFRWSTNPIYPNNNGGVTYDATINSGNVTLDRNITIQRLFLNGGTLSGPFELTLNEGITWSGGSLSGPTVNLSAGSTSTIGRVSLDGTINNSGSLNQSDAMILGEHGIINNLAGATWNLLSACSINRPGFGFVPPPTGQFNNAGNVVVTANTDDNLGIFLGTTFNNSGNVTVQTATPGGFSKLSLLLGSASGTFNLGTQTELAFNNYVLNSGATLTGAGTVSNEGVLNIAGDTTINTSLVNTSTLSVGAGATLTMNGSFTHTPPGFLTTLATTRLDGGTIASPQTLGFQNGVLAGHGTINANLDLSGSILQSQLGGTSAGGGANNYDSISVNGATALGGSLGVFFKNGFETSIGVSDTFTVLTSGSGFTGSFDNAANGSRMDTGDYLGTFLVNYGKSSIGLSNFVPNTRWLGGNGNWTDGTRWLSNPLFPNDNASTHYSALIRDGSVNLDTNITVSRFLLTGGSLIGGNTLTITGSLAWIGGNISGGAGSSINLAAGSISSISNPLDATVSNPKLSGRVLNNFGTVNQSADISSNNPRETFVNNMAGATWNIDTTRVGSFIGSTAYNNAGNMAINGSVSTFGVVNNSGVIVLQASSVAHFDGGGSASGSFDVAPQAYVSFGFSPLHTYTFTNGAMVTGSGTVIIDQVNVAGNTSINPSVSNLGSLMVQPGVTLTLNGPFKQGNFSSNNFTTNLQGATLTDAQSLSFESGNLIGSGTINGNVTIGADTTSAFTHAVISPGDQFNGHGEFVINGNLSLLNTSKVVMSLVGGTQAHNDSFDISGSVMLDGTLELNTFLVPPDSGETFTLFSSNLLSGTFDNIANGARLKSANNNISFQVNYGAGSPYGANNVVLSDPQVVPEPASLVLFATGMAVFGFARLRRR